ncbi:putative rhamnogalacturonate lyase B [Senna tora]|uniref:Putative rhamnogalacturonate lyase B n=1 Tax=Senna tora TaxID=362788 RepID=A0A834SMK3_9FABA|nr:putative rhamnogalacturonate lyase B [Senna tora]
MTVHSHTDIAAQPPSESTHVGGLKLWNPRLYERIRNLSIPLHRRRSEDGDGGRGGRPPATLTTDYCLARVAASQESAVNKERLIKKVFGPAFYYFNSILNHHHSQTLWADVVQQTRTFKEEDSLMLVNSDAYVGLALPGKAGSGFLSDYKYNLSITVTPGGVIEMGSLIYFFAKLCIIIYELASFDQFEEIEWEVFISCCSVNEKLYNGSQGQGLLHSSMGN